MKVHLAPTGLHSRAMKRVTRALSENAPSSVQLVDSIQDADLVLVHAIGADAIEQCAQLAAQGKRYVIAQYCLASAGAEPVRWFPAWQRAELVWSYYDLEGEYGELCKAKYLRTPLGLDPAFARWDAGVLAPERSMVVTVGYVHGRPAESILEPWQAANLCGLDGFHVGPNRPENMPTLPPGWVAGENISDEQLATLYGRAVAVAGLRYVEGFEMPAAEALACGARPILFDQPTLRDWYGDLALYVREQDGDALVCALKSALEVARECPVTEEERAEALRRFDWQRIAARFWQSIDTGSSSVTSIQPASGDRERLKVLWVGDAIVPSGFAACTHAACDALQAAGHQVDVIGINYYGDPHDKPYRVWPAVAPLDYCGDAWGVDRLPRLIHRLRPDVVVILQDPWNIPEYLRAITATLPTSTPCPPIVGWIAVDGENQRSAPQLNRLAAVATWTDFAAKELRTRGYAGRLEIVPLGVDLNLFQPRDRAQSRRQVLGDAVSSQVGEGFVVGVVGRNQPRKRLDLTLDYFAHWVQSKGIKDAYLLMHVGPTGDRGFDLHALADYHGLRGRIFMSDPGLGAGLPADVMPTLYSAMDALVTTSQGEGWGLPELEAMACGVPVMAPDWSGLGSWARDAAILIPCTATACTAPVDGRMHTVGGIADRNLFVEGLDALYRSPRHREAYGKRGRRLAEQYPWSRAAEGMRELIESVAGFEAACDDAPQFVAESAEVLGVAV